MLMLPTPTNVLDFSGDNSYYLVRYGEMYDANYNELPRILCSVRDGVLRHVFTAYGNIILPTNPETIY